MMSEVEGYCPSCGDQRLYVTDAHCTVGTWLIIMEEEMAKLKAVEDPVLLEDHLIDVMAAAAQWIKCIHRRKTQ